MTRRRWVAVAAAVALIVVLWFGGGLAVVLEVEEPTKPARSTVTVPVDGTDKDRAADDQLVAPRVAVEQAARTELGEHDGAKSETPVGVAPEVIEEGRDQQDRFAARDRLEEPPAAAPVQAGCRSRFVASHSSRRGVRPRIFALHYTVSPNRPGWSDVDGVTTVFARASFAASSHFVIDREGHCNYIVRETDKSWTQATFNPVAISVEIINSGREPNLIDGPGLQRLARVMSDSTRRWGIPLRVGQVNGCTVTRSGVVTHQMLGACGGGHVDVLPYRLDPVLAAARAARGGNITAADRATCRKLLWWRRAGRPHGKAERNAISRRRTLERRGVTCTARGPVRRA